MPVQRMLRAASQLKPCALIFRGTETQGANLSRGPFVAGAGVDRRVERAIGALVGRDVVFVAAVSQAVIASRSRWRSFALMRRAAKLAQIPSSSANISKSASKSLIVSFGTTIPTRDTTLSSPDDARDRTAS